MCKICKLTMSKFAIKKHAKKCHATSKPFNCELCSEEFQKPEYRITHMSLIHKDDFKCSNCNIQFYMSHNYIEHMLNFHDTHIDITPQKEKSEIDVPIERLRFVSEILEIEVRSLT
jgi:hypothetical protein